MDFAHAGLSTLRLGSRWASLNQRADSRRDRHTALPGLATNDWRALAQRLRGGGFCDPSLARGIGRVGVGTQGCAQRLILHADNWSVRALCAWRMVGHPLRACHHPVCVRSHVQTNAGYHAIGAAAAGLLASEPFHPAASRRWQHFQDSVAVDPRKIAFVHIVFSVLFDHHFRSKKRSASGHKDLVALARGQCRRRV